MYYEVTLTLDGILHTVSVHATDAAAINDIITHMFGTSQYSIINIIRKG